MKDKKTKKSKALDGKKVSTAKAIASTLKKKKPKLSKSLEKLPITIINKTNSDNNLNNLDDYRPFKKFLTIKEAKFLEYYISGDYTIEAAMIKAGYEGYSQSQIYYLAGEIRKKVELQADDHKKLFRELGAGEILVVKTLLSLIEDPSAKIRLGAVTQLAKILDLTKEQLDGAGGITLILESAEGARVQIVGQGAPPLPATPVTLPGPTSTKPIMITK